MKYILCIFHWTWLFTLFNSILRFFVCFSRSFASSSSPITSITCWLRNSEWFVFSYFIDLLHLVEVFLYFYGYSTNIIEHVNSRFIFHLFFYISIDFYWMWVSFRLLQFCEIMKWENNNCVQSGVFVLNHSLMSVGTVLR